MSKKDYLKTIKESLKSKKVIIGTEETLKNLKNNKLKTVFLASNVKASVKDEIISLGKMSEVEVVPLDIPNSEFGTICRKPFPISILSIMKV